MRGFPGIAPGSVRRCTQGRQPRQLEGPRGRWCYRWWGSMRCPCRRCVLKARKKAAHTMRSSGCLGQGKVALMRPHGAAPVFFCALAERGAHALGRVRRNLRYVLRGGLHASSIPSRHKEAGRMPWKGRRFLALLTLGSKTAFFCQKPARSLLNQRWNGSRRRRLARQVGPCQRWLSGKPSRPKKAEAPSGWFPEDARSQNARRTMPRLHWRVPR